MALTKQDMVTLIEEHKAYAQLMNSLADRFSEPRPLNEVLLFVMIGHLKDMKQSLQRIETKLGI